MPQVLANAEGAWRRPPDSKMLTYLASVLHCCGEQKNRKNNLLEAGRMKCKWGNPNIAFFLSRRSSIGIFFFSGP